MPRNALRRHHLLDGFCWFGLNFQLLWYAGLAQATSSKKGVFPSTWRARRGPMTVYLPPVDKSGVLEFGPEDLAAVAQVA